jgi:hypothetical protein
MKAFGLFFGAALLAWTSLIYARLHTRGSASYACP